MNTISLLSAPVQTSERSIVEWRLHQALRCASWSFRTAVRAQGCWKSAPGSQRCRTAGCSLPWCTSDPWTVRGRTCCPATRSWARDTRPRSRLGVHMPRRWLHSMWTWLQPCPHTGLRICERAAVTVSTLSIQTKAFFSTGSRRDAELNRDNIWCHSVRSIKVLRMQPSDEDYDIIWRSCMSVKFAKRLHT